MNFRFRVHIVEAIDQACQGTRFIEATVVLALLNEGLDVVGKKRGGQRRR